MRPLLPYLKLMWEWKWAFIPSIIFNFRFLPLKQAIRLPIWLNKPHLYKMKAKIRIDASNIKPGMIKLGGFGGHIYPNNGIHLTLWGGVIIFKGTCEIGNNSFIVLGKDAVVTFGDHFVASTSLKLVSFKNVEFGEYVRLGWGVIVMDTNFHPLYDMEKKKFKKAYGPIKIGNNNWISSQCKVLHSVETPHHCIFGFGSLVTRGCEFESYAVHGGSPLHVLSRNVERVIGQDIIESYAD